MDRTGTGKYREGCVCVCGGGECAEEEKEEEEEGMRGRSCEAG